MKELSVEEKAKRYDEAKARMSKAYNDNRCTLGFMNEIFPELKENEDERVRNKLIEFFKGYSPDEEWWGNITQEDILAWIEKQGKQKTVDEIAKEVCKNKESAMVFLKSTGIMNEKGELADEYKIEQDEQNSTWSEEDEDYFDAIIAKLEITQEDALLTDNQMEFLKSIKDRVQFQNSIVTDEELAQAKKEAYNDALDKIEYHSDEPTFDDGWSAAIGYIRKKAINPQPHWKPSEKQMQALSDAGNSFRPFEEGHKVLWSLYNDLKKLREK
jgi:hypothetical protein